MSHSSRPTSLKKPSAMTNAKRAPRYLGRWVRSYAADLDDQARQSLSDPLYRTLDDLERISSETKGALPAVSVIAFRLRLKPREVEHRLKALIDAGLIIRQGDELKPRDWDDRQYETTSTDRVRKHRNGLKSASQGNADETFHETPIGVSVAVSETSRGPPTKRDGNGDRNADETYTENQRDRDRESSSSVSAKAARAKDDDVLQKLKGAANLAHGCANVAPIRALMAEGCDLEADILPFFRERVAKLASPLRNLAAPWLAAEIRAAARDRKSREAPTSDGPQRAPAGHFVSADDPRWAALCARYRKERGSGRPPPSAKNHSRPGGPPGWYFEPAWIAALGPAAPAEAAE
jgi:DNA-binding transcriptional ArsR family regulator